MPAPKILEHVDLTIENGDCRLAAYTTLAVLAYPEKDKHTERSRFVDAAYIGYLRWNRGLLPNECRWELDAELAAAPAMPVQQADGTLHRGMKRIRHRLFAAEVLQQLLLANLFRPGPPSNGVRRLEWDHQDINTLKVINDADDGMGPSILAVIRALALRRARSLPVGGRDEKAFKNIQDRIMRPSYPVLHLALALLEHVLGEQPSERTTQTCDHWGTLLLKKPAWVRKVVPKGMSGVNTYWLLMRELGLIVPYEAMLSVEIFERNSMAA